MSDTEERIQKLQKLLDRVLARDDQEGSPEMPGDAPTIEQKSDADAVPADGVTLEETTAEVEVPHRTKAPPKLEASEEPRKGSDDAPLALESASRLVAATSPESQGALEVTEADLIPDSEAEGPGSAVPLVKRSPIELSSDELVSEGRISLDRIPVSSSSFVEDEASAADVARTRTEEQTEDVEATDLLDEAPTSSRRPIAIPEEEHSAPRHTPPPESGKQVAAPSLSGPESKGMRKSNGPPALPPLPSNVAAVVPPPEPEAIHAALAEGAKVASFNGAPATPPRPATFGELLDVALDL